MVSIEMVSIEIVGIEIVDTSEYVRFHKSYDSIVIVK